MASKHVWFVINIGLGALGLLTGALASICTEELLPETGTPPRCLVLNTACWTAVAYAYNQPEQGLEKFVAADYAVLPSNLMNFVWCNEYAGNHEAIFANFGRAGSLDAHLITFYLAARKPSVQTMIYMNAPGGLTNFVSGDNTLAAIPVLERIREEYPEAAADAEQYLDYLKNSGGYEKALAEYGADWRRRFDFETFQFFSNPIIHAVQKRLDGWFAGVFRIRQLALAARPVQALQKLPSGLRCRKPDNVRTLLHLLQGCSTRYQDSSNLKPFLRLIPENEIWAMSGGNAWQAWANIVAKICQAKNIRLVYYIPPHIHVSDQEYQTVLRPAYVTRVRRAFRAFPHVVVIDHANDATLNHLDFIWHYRAPGRSIKTSFVPNAIGRLKVARLLITSLTQMGILGADEKQTKYLGSAWPGEKKVPRVARDVRLVPADDPETDFEHAQRLDWLYRGSRLTRKQERP